MKTTIRIAALLLTGVVFMGCDKKDETTTTPPTTPASPTAPTVNAPTMTTPTMTTPASPTAPDMSGKMGQINSAIDKGAANAKSEADKMLNSAPTTMPAMPALGK